ncbi:helix-turn-helix domain-containing protein [uncultured Prevotella sp.]|uniref:helix-turn-helix domain-containing protein n=1 Tax=uncultured Prevotella sp. TaxID=159272 RepID=UPI002582AB0C|nr:helix-turn-helix domain-containing protein [uncultured Prevotella sp.]
MKHYYTILFFISLLPLLGSAQEQQELTFPRLEQLSAQHVTHVIQDSEGYLWYGTEGGGVCRDDGHQILVFRSDAEHPDLLGSNSIACLAEATQRYIIIGTYHGAFLLDKHDYSIRRMIEVDDKRVDDIIISKNGHWWMTSNKKVYEYADRKLINIYPAGDKYIFRLQEDQEGMIWATEWEGGLLQLKDGHFIQVRAKNDTIDFRRIMTDDQGRQLVANGLGECHALDNNRQKPFFDGKFFTKFTGDSIRRTYGLSTRPTAIALPPRPSGRLREGELWFSTGKDIRCKTKDTEQIILPDTKDVSAMVFAKDGTLWLATIFGTIMTYKDGQLLTDEYASNEYGDAVLALQTDSLGRLIIVYDRYVRLYDPTRQTLRQQNIEADGIYRIELQETEPGKRWSMPQQSVAEQMPLWIWWLIAVLLLSLIALSGYILFLRRQRQRFLTVMKRKTTTPEQIQEEQTAEEQPSLNEEWLQQAIDYVDKNIADEHYSVEQLSNDLCMSRMTLYRKIQSATGQKPTEFIRTIRLRRAAELLREGRLTITEISYATGFSSVSYFSRCFRTMYGVAPTQFITS